MTASPSQLSLLVGSEIWTGSKRQKDALRAKFGGKCAYCGGDLDKMHADHVKPITRVDRDPWGNQLPMAERKQMHPEYNVVSNMMPACIGCNLHKGGYSLEEWRALLGHAASILARDKSLFRAALRFGIISANAAPIKFYFEKIGCAS